MKKIFLALVLLFILFVILSISVMTVQASCTDMNQNLGSDVYVYQGQTGYVSQYPDDGSPDPTVDPAPLPTPEPGDDGENQYTWRWNTNNDDAPEPGGKDK